MPIDNKKHKPGWVQKNSVFDDMDKIPTFEDFDPDHCGVPFTESFSRNEDHKRNLFKIFTSDDVNYSSFEEIEPERELEFEDF